VPLDGPRRRLQVRGGTLMPSRPACRPPWWPDSEPWPPRRQFPRRYGPPARFFRGLAALIAAMTLVGFAGVIALIWIALTKLGAAAVTQGSAAPLVIALAVTVALAAAVMVGRSFRRVRNPLEAVMDAADRVAAGDYSVRVPEQGPPAIRGL